MKILGQSVDETVLVQMSKNELALILGYQGKYSAESNLGSNGWVSPGREYAVDERLEQLQTLATLPSTITEFKSANDRLQKTVAAIVKLSEKTEFHQVKKAK